MKKVTVLGCGNWGTTVAKIVGENLPRLLTGFDTNVSNLVIFLFFFEIFKAIYFQVYMWVFEETVRGRKLSEIINTDHENTKYLPGIKVFRFWRMCIIEFSMSLKSTFTFFAMRSYLIMLWLNLISLNLFQTPIFSLWCVMLVYFFGFTPYIVNSLLSISNLITTFHYFLF